MYIILACESKVTGETVFVERYLFEDDPSWVLRDIRFTVCEMLYGVEVQTHWFQTDKIIALMSPFLSEIGGVTTYLRSIGCCTLYENTVDDVSFLVEARERSSVRARGPVLPEDRKRLPKKP